jgi:hypothetical protein
MFKLTYLTPLNTFFHGSQYFISLFTKLSCPHSKKFKTAHVLPHYFLQISIKFCFYLLVNLSFSSGLSPPHLRTKSLSAPLHFPVCATCPSTRFHDLNTQIIFVEGYITRNFSLCTFLQSPITSRHLGQNILLGTKFANICSALNVIHINIKQQNNYNSVYFNP